MPALVAARFLVPGRPRLNHLHLPSRRDQARAVQAKPTMQQMQSQIICVHSTAMTDTSDRRAESAGRCA